MNNEQIPSADHVKYLGLHLDSKLTWRHHIFTKRKQLDLALTKMYWLLGRRSRLSLSNKLLLYKSILKPIWTYGIQLWSTASTSNIEILERFQSKTLRILVDAPVVRAQPSHPSGPSNAFRQRINMPLKSPLLHPPHHPSQRPSSSPPGTTRHQVITTTYAQRSAWQIRLLIVVVIILVSKVQL
jgi:hypothetical protein